LLANKTQNVINSLKVLHIPGSLHPSPILNTDQRLYRVVSRFWHCVLFLCADLVLRMMTRRTRVFLLLISVVIVTVWYYQRVFYTEGHRAKLFSVSLF